MSDGSEALPGAERDTRRLAYAIHEAVCTAYKHEGRNALCERAALAVFTSEFLDDYANAVLLAAAQEWPTMTRDMVSRGYVRKWLEDRAAKVLPPGGGRA
jgi:hypothetical protein